MIRLMEECYNLQNYCIDGNTPVTLASGVSMRIKDLAACPEVPCFFAVADLMVSTGVGAWS